MLDIRPNSKTNQFRRARVELLNTLIAEVLAQKASCSIIDIGGTLDFWRTWKDEIDWSRVSVTCANLNPSHLDEGQETALAKMISADACDLNGIKDNAFDIAFSNSVIEHVGSWRNMVAMANEVRRVAPKYLLQTPYFWFPIEPHARTPFIHWLPQSWTYRLVMTRTNGYWPRQDNVSGAVAVVQSAQLVDFRQMQALFPDADVKRERFLGLTKSLIAVRH